MLLTTRWRGDMAPATKTRTKFGIPSPMLTRRLGSSGLQVSVIGIGTAQLRCVPAQQALETLCRAFKLGVTLVHTAPDYEGADDLVAEAVASSGREIIVASQGYGSREYFEHLFESTCQKLGKKRLELFGIACIDDREKYGEDVWGPNGIVQFLAKKNKKAG